MKTILCFVALALVLIFALAAVATDANDDTLPIQGSWRAISGELSGKPLPAEALKDIVLKLEAGHYEVAVAGKPDKGTYALITTAKPKRIDVTLGLGPDAGHTIPAIYELSGDSLKICYALRGSNAPSDFKTAAGTLHYLLNYRRVKPVSAEAK